MVVSAPGRGGGARLIMMSKNHWPAAGQTPRAAFWLMGIPMMRGQFTPGPWTSAVQGPKFLNYFFQGLEGKMTCKSLARAKNQGNGPRW